MEFLWNDNVEETLKQLGERRVDCLSLQSVEVSNELFHGKVIEPTDERPASIQVVPSCVFGPADVNFSICDFMSGDLLYKIAEDTCGIERANDMILLGLYIPAKELYKPLGNNNHREFMLVDRLEPNWLDHWFGIHFPLNEKMPGRYYPYVTQYRRWQPPGDTLRADKSYRNGCSIIVKN